MTASTEDSQRLPALRSTEPCPAVVARPHLLIQGIRMFTIVTALVGVGCLAAAFGVEEWRVALAGSTLVVLAAVAGAVLVANALIADRMAFYEHGKADGWYEGWRGIPPNPDHPFVRH